MKRIITMCSMALLFGTAALTAQYNDMSSNPNTATAQNPELITKIRQALQNNPDLNIRAIQVTSDNNGNITLKGFVKTSAQKDQAESIAKNIPGVNNVDNQLTTQETQNQY